LINPTPLIVGAFFNANQMPNDKKVLERLSSFEHKIDLLAKAIQPIRAKKYYSYAEASELLCISVEGLKTRIKRGQMNRICNNSRPLIAQTEIERFLNAQNPKLIRNN
jgi:hypothetical protein